MSLSFGVIGCGYWGPNYVRNLSEIPGASVEAVSDTSGERLEHIKGRYPSVKTHLNSHALLMDEGLDAVVISTPVKTHYELTKRALEAGKHVLVEKPMASSSAECEELIELAEKKGLTLMVGHTYLYSEPIRKVFEIIKSGDLGRLRYINSQRLSLGLFQKDVNVAWDLAPHDLSIMMHAIGAVPDQINCQGSANVTPGVEDVANISLKFPDSVFATIQNSWLEPSKVRQITFVGTRRTIVYDDLEPRDKIKVYDVRVDRPPHYDNFSDFQYAYHYGDTYIPRVTQSEPLAELCRHFCSCILDSQTPLTCGRRGLEVVRVLEATSESLVQGGASISYHQDGGSLQQSRPQVLDRSPADLLA